MTASKGRPTVGDECWEVEWCTFLGVDKNGDHDFDRDKMAVRDFATFEEAKAFGATVWPKSQSGLVQITPYQFVAYDEDDAGRYPHAGFWQATDDGWVIDDESGEPVR